MLRGVNYRGFFIQKENTIATFLISRDPPRPPQGAPLGESSSGSAQGVPLGDSLTFVAMVPQGTTLPGDPPGGSPRGIPRGFPPDPSGGSPWGIPQGDSLKVDSPISGGFQNLSSRHIFPNENKSSYYVRCWGKPGLDFGGFQGVLFWCSVTIGWRVGPWGLRGSLGSS